MDMDKSAQESLLILD